jgi:hypothetical protein
MIDGCTRRLISSCAKPQSVPGNQVLAADARGESRETLGDELGMFDDVRAVADDRLRAFPDVEIPGSAIIR